MKKLASVVAILAMIVMIGGSAIAEERKDMDRPSHDQDNTYEPWHWDKPIPNQDRGYSVSSPDLDVTPRGDIESHYAPYFRPEHR